MEPIREKPRGKVKKIVEEVLEKTIEVIEDSKSLKRSEEKKHKSSKRVRRNRKVAIVLAIALGIGAWYTLIGPGSRIVVPSTVGGSYDDAIAAFNPLGITSIKVEKRFDEEIAKGTIIESIPPGGGRIDNGGSVTLIISKGPERYLIPVLKGLTPEAAKSAIGKLPLTFRNVSEAFNSEVPQGFVISSSPEAGLQVKRYSVVDLVVSKGIETVAVVSYLGKSGEQALNELTSSGFNVESTYAFDEKILAGAVISQNPMGDASIPKGAKIRLVVSKGSEYVFIPNVFSIDEAKAIKALKDLELKVIVKKLGSKKLKKVTNISPKVGSKVKRGSTVTITVG